MGERRLLASPGSTFELCVREQSITWVSHLITVMDPGFPWGGGGRRPPMRALVGKYECKNERIGSRWGWERGHQPPGSANALNSFMASNCLTHKSLHDWVAMALEWRSKKGSLVGVLQNIHPIFHKMKRCRQLMVPVVVIPLFPNVSSSVLYRLYT